MKKSAAAILITVTIFWLASINGAKPALGAENNIYNLRLFADDELLGNPNNQDSYWFDIRPGVQVTGNAYLELYYSFSEVFLADQSYITVSVNGIPVASRRLSGQSDINTPWILPIPLNLINDGTNEIRISTLQRTTEGLCKDIDNSADWLVVHNNTVLHLETQYNEDLLINNYPRPFLDYLDSQPVKSTFYLPDNPTPDEIAAMLQMAADWGAREPYKQLPLAVKIGYRAGEGGNKIFIGGPGRWSGIADINIPPGSGLLSLVKNEEEEGGYRLYVAGNGSGGLAKATGTLSQPKALEQISEHLSIIGEVPQILPGTHMVGRPGTYALSDLGYQDINLPGAFHQRTSVVIKRPLRRKIGSSSYIEVHFRHSEAINGRNSALTVYINGRPLASTVLNAGNEKNGVIRVNIPRDELDKPEWLVEFAFYHDIGAVDCSKRYDEVAWSVVEKETLVYLAGGDVEDYPTLAYFPYLGYLDGQNSYSPTMWLPAAPNSQELTLAAIIAARAGQKNLGGINWQVILGDSPEEEKLKKGTVIMIGQQKDGMFSGLKGVLPVWPGGQGGYETAVNMGIATQTLGGAAIIEAANSPWSSSNVVYALIGSDNGSLEMAEKVLINSARLEQNDPQVGVVSRDGNTTTYKVPEVQKDLGLWEKIKDFFHGGQYQNSLVTYAAIVGLAVLGVGITIFIAWRRSR